MPAENDPVAPYDLSGYPLDLPASGGQTRRLRTPNEPLKSLGGGRGGKAGRSRRAPGAKAQRPSSPKTRHVRSPHHGRNTDGNHSAQRTHAHGGGHTATLHRPHGATRLPPEVRALHHHLRSVVSSGVTGPVMGFSFGSVAPLGHHPRADGKQHAPSTQHQAIIRRGTIVAYNSGTNTATVRFGDTPDSATIALKVSPMITSAVAGAATLAGVHLWSDTDPTDALISAVL